MEEELQKLTVVKLKEKLTEKGLDTKGVKAILVKRLLEALQNDAGTTDDKTEVTSVSEFPAIEDTASHFDDDTNGKETKPSEVTEYKPGSTLQDASEPSSDEPIAAIIGTDDALQREALKRSASSLAEGGESKRQRLGSGDDDAVTQEAPDPCQSGEKIYLSLLGDESSGNEAGGITDEPVLTDQQESSLLGEDSTEGPNADGAPVDESNADSLQNALESENEFGSENETSQDPQAIKSGASKDAQSIGRADEVVPDKNSGNSGKDLESEREPFGESEAAKDVSVIDPSSESVSKESRSLTERSTRRQDSLKGDYEKKREQWTREQRTTVTLDEYTSDLNCHIDPESMSITPFTDSQFALMSAGVKCTHGFVEGKIRFDVKVLELLEVDVEGEKHQLRIGFCRRLDRQSVRLGEDQHSWALCSNGKKASGGTFESFVDLPDLEVGDLFSSLLNLDQNPAELRFAHNGKDLGLAFEFPNETRKAVVKTSDEEEPSETSPTTEQIEKPITETTTEDPENSSDEAGGGKGRLALYPTVLTKNVKVEVNLGQSEKPLSLGESETVYLFPSNVEESERVKDDIAPYTKRECELIMMIGLPSSGKSTWVHQHLQKYPEKHYNVLGTASILNRMTAVDGRPQMDITQGGSDELVKKAMNCLTKLIDAAAQQRRNIILDETNVNGSVQANKWRLFDGFKRRAVVVVTSADTLRERHAKRPTEEILLSEKTITEMKACFQIPTGSQFRGCVTFAELAREEAEKVIEKYNDEAARELGIEPRGRRHHPNHSDFNRSASGSREFHRGPRSSLNRGHYGDFRPRGAPGRGNFYSGPNWGPMRGGGPNSGPASRWGRGGMPPQHFQPQQSRGSHTSSGRLGGGPYNRNGSEGGGSSGPGGRSGGDYRSQRPDWKSSSYHSSSSSSRDRDSDDRSGDRSGRDSRKYPGREYRDDSRDSRDSSRDTWSRGGDRRESHSRFSQSSSGRWSSTAVSASTGSRFSPQVSPQRGNPSYDSSQKQWTHGQHQPPQQPQQSQHKPGPHVGTQSSWPTTQSQPTYNQPPQSQPAQQQQQWYQWQQWYSDPRQRTPAQNPEPWKGHNVNQWVTAAGPRAAAPDSAQKAYQAPQHLTNQQQQNQWSYWQQWQQRPTGPQPTPGASAGNQYENAQQYQQHIAQWKQQCARYYEQNQQQPHQSQHK